MIVSGKKVRKQNKFLIRKQGLKIIPSLQESQSKKLQDGYALHQAVYASKFSPLTCDWTFEEVRAGRHKLAWLTHTRLNIFASDSHISRVVEATFNQTSIKLTNATMKRS